MAQKHRILMIGDVEFPPIDPRIYKEARTLISAGHEVRLLHRGTEGQKKYDVYEEIGLYRLKITRNWTGNKTIDYSIGYLFFSLVASQKLRSIRKEFNFDVIHVHNPPDFLVTFCAPFARVNDIPIVFDVHDPFPELLLNRPDVSAKRFIAKLATVSQKWTLEAARETITVNETIAKNLEKIRAKKVHVVMNCSPTGTRNLEPTKSIITKYNLQNSTVVLYEGAMVVMRGLYLLIDAVALLRDRGKNVKLLMVGSGPILEDLKSHVKKVGLDELVIFTGRVPFDEVPDYISTADIVVIPFEPSPINNLGSPNKLFEYMAAGKPILASNLPVLSKILDGTGHLVQASAEGFADGIEFIEGNEKLIAEMTNKGLGLVANKYNWGEMGKRLVELYENL